MKLLLLLGSSGSAASVAAFRRVSPPLCRQSTRPPAGGLIGLLRRVCHRPRPRLSSFSRPFHSRIACEESRAGRPKHRPPLLLLLLRFLEVIRFRCSRQQQQKLSCFSATMGRFEQVLVLEVESAKDKSKETEGGKYRRDSPWLVEAFLKKGVKSRIVFLRNGDTAESLVDANPATAFLGRVNPMDYPEIRLEEYVTMLNGLKDAGVLLGPDAEHMDRLGSKMILYELRDTAMGIDGVLLHDFAALQKNDGEIDAIIPVGSPPRVLKMLRGSTGLGVWKLENSSASDDGAGNVLLTDAYTQTTDEIPREDVIPRFLALCQEDAISMPFLPLIKDGEFRFLMSRHEVLEVVHKRPVDESAFTATLRSGAVYTTIDLVEHRDMVDAVVQWSYDIKSTLGLADVPYWWSVDCIEEEVDGDGDGGLKPGHISSGNPGRRLVLSEINCSCLGLVADTSAEAKAKGMRFADMIADIVLKD